MILLSKFSKNSDARNGGLENESNPMKRSDLQEDQGGMGKKQKNN